MVWGVDIHLPAVLMFKGTRLLTDSHITLPWLGDDSPKTNSIQQLPMT